MELVTAAQMRAVEQAAMDSGAVTGFELMERAGRGVVDAILEKWPEQARSPRKVVVLCGPGNNGGDGFVVARLLAEKGWAVDVYLLGSPDTLPQDAAENCRRWAVMGAVRDIASFTRPDPTVDLYVDALFGTGLRRVMAGDVLRVARLLDASPILRERTVAVDAPSGLCLDSGRVLNGGADAQFRAALTVTFHRPKPGHFLADGPACCGDLKTVDIGLAAAWGGPGLITLADAPAPAAVKQAGHKYDHGHVLVCAGGVGKGGAARLAARGALRIGAGAVTVAPPRAALIENAMRLDAIMLTRRAGVDGMRDILRDERLNTLVIGPGLGVGAETCEIVKAAFAARPVRGVVLDADALTSFAAVETGQGGADLFAMTAGARAVLTPHMGEFRRLFPDIHARLNAPAAAGPAYSKTDAVRDAAARAGCVVLLKGPDTVIADAEGAVSIAAAVRERACPWLATAGAGDVLAGIIAGLMARGWSPRDAAEAGAMLHQDCALSFGPGLIAEDLPEELPKVLRALI